MFINNKDIKLFSAKLIDRVVSTNKVDSIFDWLPTAISGTLLSQNYNFKTIKLTFLIKENSEDAAYKKISLLTEELKNCQLRFDDINLTFPCFLDSTTEPERLKNGKFKVIYTLKNTWGIGNRFSQDFDLTTVNCIPVTVNYILHWQNTMGLYSECFDKQEQEQKVGQETIWVNLETLDAIIAESRSWDQLLANLGIDLQAYHPENALSGTTWVEKTFSAENAKELIASQVINVIYMRFHKDGYKDLPEAYYPSMVWSVDNQNKYYIDLGIGNGWNIRDISIYVTGRYFQSAMDGNGCIVGAGKGMPFNINFNNPNAIIETDTPDSNRYSEAVMSTSSSGSGGAGNVSLYTLESLSGLPLRKYGFRSSIDSSAPIAGYCDLVFNGVTLNRVPLKRFTLTKNLTLMYGNQGIGNWAEASRVQVYYKGILVLDAIPIDGNVKNGFINSYDGGFYDMVNMKFLPWVNFTSEEVGPHPEDIMNPDVTPDTPTDDEFVITFNPNGGTLTSIGSITTVNKKLTYLPQAPVLAGYVFKGWYSAATNGSKITTNTQFSNNTTVYAQWTEESQLPTYTITLNPVGGTLVSSNTIQVKEGTTTTLPTPTKEGSIFNGWFTSADGGLQFTNTTPVTSNLTLYAHWKEASSDVDVTITVADTKGNIINTGDTIYAGTKIMLVASNESTSIKYTLDETDPKLGINYTSFITINNDTVLRAVAMINGEYGQEIWITIKTKVYTPPAEKGKLLQYGDVAMGTFDFPVHNINDITPNDWDVNPPKALLPFAAVYSIAGVTGTWEYYSCSWFKKVREGVLSDGRSYAVFDVTTATSKKGCYIKFIPSDGSSAITQNFRIASLY